MLEKNEDPLLSIIPHDFIRLAKSVISDWHKEHFIGIYVSRRGKPIKTELISLGTLTSGLVHPRETFKPAFTKSAYGVILLHNHPSGDPSPSKDDKEITKQLIKAGRILGIRVIDHIIFMNGGWFYSFRDQSRIKFD